MKAKLLFIVFYLSLAIQFSEAQVSDTSKFNLPLLRLISYGDSLLKGSTDEIRISNNELFSSLADSILQNPDSYKLSFFQTNTLSVLNSPDGKFRIYNWMLPLQNNSRFSYYGYVQIYDEKSKEIKLYHLKSIEYENNEEAETIHADTNKWFGCVYYKVVHERKAKKDYYVLLGWAPHTALSTRKVIEPLNLSGNKISFGSPVIKTGGKAKMRMIFEYNSQVTMSLKFIENKNMLIFDHLASSDPRPESKGMYHLYGPDLSYDALIFKNGLWNFQKNIDIKSNSTDEGKNPQIKKMRITKTR